MPARTAAAAALAATLVLGGQTHAAIPETASAYPPGDARYHSYAEMREHIQAAEAAHPAIVRVFSIGETHERRRIWAAEVSDAVGTDEGEPEVLLDGLHHAREHLSAEQAIAAFDWLVDHYGETDRLGRRVTAIVDSRRIWIVFMVNPDGLVYDLGGRTARPGHYRNWRTNRQPNGRGRAVGTDLNRNYGHAFGGAGSSGSPSSQMYRGPHAFSALETRSMRNFVESRVVGGRQRITAHISFHTAGEQVLWPYGHTRADAPSDMTDLDARALRALGRAMAARNGYRAMQSSSLYLTSGDQIDWMYARHRIFSYTFELFPRGGGTPRRWYPPDDVIGRQTRRNRDAILHLMERAGCPYAALSARSESRYCGPLFDDLEVDRGWRRDPSASDTATDGHWARVRARPAQLQLGTAISGRGVLMTAQGDVDGGRTTIRSPLFRLPDDGRARLHLRYWLGHATGAGAEDGLRVHVVDPDGVVLATLLEMSGNGERRDPAWRTLTARIPAELAGLRVGVLLEAVDAGEDAIVEAGIDDVRVTHD
jgi:murein tripeptide amidase MpaA